MFVWGPHVRKLFRLICHSREIKFIALHCIVLHCIVLYCIVLYCIVLYCIVLPCIDGWGGIGLTETSKSLLVLHNLTHPLAIVSDNENSEMDKFCFHLMSSMEFGRL